jgi:hypothetical protein
MIRANPGGAASKGRKFLALASGLGQSETPNHVRDDGSFPRKRSLVRATVAPSTTVNRACNWWRNLLQLRTMGPATVASATGQLLPFIALSKAREMM